MHYVCLIYRDEDRIESLPAGVYEEMLAEAHAQLEQLEQSGKVVVTNSMESPPSATTVRVRHGKMAITGGSAKSDREHLGGFCVIDAADLNDAIRIASRMPAARLGSVEVRPVSAVERL